MTHDPIHAALAARADEHERSFDASPAGDSDEPVSEFLRLSKTPTPVTQGRSRLPRVAVVAAAAAVITLAGGIALGGGSDGSRLGSTDDTSSDSAPEASDLVDGNDLVFTEQAARSYLEAFFAALNRRDFVTASEMLGGDDMAAEIAEALGPRADDRAGEALERYCATAFCGGQTVGESALVDGDVRLFLVTTPIPPGSLGGGEPAEEGVEHGMEFRVMWVDGTLRVGDLPPTFTDL